MLKTKTEAEGKMNSKIMDEIELLYCALQLQYSAVKKAMLTAHPEWLIQPTKLGLCKHFVADYISYSEELEMYNYDLENLTKSELKKNYDASVEAIKGLRDYAKYIVEYSRRLLKEVK